MSIIVIIITVIISIIYSLGTKHSEKKMRPLLESVTF